MNFKVSLPVIVQYGPLYMLRNCFIIFAAALLISTCSQSSAQRDFENEAFRFPDNITETTPNGSLVENGQVDPDDWRIGPDYQGLIDVDPAYPNPVNLDGNMFIQVDFLFSNPVSQLIVFALQDPSQPIFIQDFQQNSLSGVEVLNIPPSQFVSGTGVGNTPYYRILITDENENVITYGDIEVVQ